MELVAAITPRFDTERLGCLLVGSPRHADILCVTGAMTRRARERAVRIYHQAPEPKVVIAIGSCALSGGVFAGSEQVSPPADQHVRVHIRLPGCPPRPESIINAICQAIRVLR